MARPSLAGLLAMLALFLQCALALKFDLHAQPGHSAKNERCIRNFVNRDTLVVVTATVGGSKGDGMVVNMHVSLSGWPTTPSQLRVSLLVGWLEAWALRGENRVESRAVC